MSGDLVCNNSSLDIITVGKSKMLLGCYVAKHSSSKGSDIGSSNGGGNVIITRGNISSEGSQGVEWSLVTPVQLVSHVLWDLIKRNVSRSLVHDLYILGPSTGGEFSLKLKLSKLRFIIGIIDGSGTETITDGKGDIIFSTDIKNIIPMLVGEVLFVVEDIPLGVDGSSTRNNACHSANSHWYETKKNGSMDGEVINSLLGLLNKSLLEYLPIQILSNSINLLQSLVDRNGSNGNRRVSHDPLSGLVNVLSSTQIHEGIGSPESTPLQLLNLLLNGRSNGRVTNIGINLHLEHTSNNLWLKLLMVLVGADDGTSPGNLRSDKFRIDIFALGNEEHFLSDQSLLGKVHLGVTFVVSFASLDPFLTNLGESFTGVDVSGTRGIVKINVGHVLVLEVDTTEWDIEQVSGRFVLYNLVFLGGLGEGIIVRNRLDTFKFRIEGIQGRVGTEGWLDIGFLGYQSLERVDGFQFITRNFRL
mmetsp:Transcript_36510/g.88489  ORF Transcript_36510/g.88489 Transcript_36510/m.88489 type:complete len:474 (+) Transcript_36510:709-2130(+)